MLGQGAGGPRLWQVGGPGFSPPVRTPREVRGSGRPARRGLRAGLGLGVPQGCWKGRHLPTFRGPDAARTWQASLWQEPAAQASIYLVRQTKLEKTPPPYATQNQRALQKQPVLPRRPLALTPRPRRGQAGAEQGPSGQLLKTRREGGLERAPPLRSAGVCRVRDQRAPGEFQNGPALVAAPARAPKASPLPPGCRTVAAGLLLPSPPPPQHTHVLELGCAVTAP